MRSSEVSMSFCEVFTRSCVVFSKSREVFINSNFLRFLNNLGLILEFSHFPGDMQSCVDGGCDSVGRLIFVRRSATSIRHSCLFYCVGAIEQGRFV